MEFGIVIISLSTVIRVIFFNPIFKIFPSIFFSGITISSFIEKDLFMRIDIPPNKSDIAVFPAKIIIAAGPPMIANTFEK